MEEGEHIANALGPKNKNIILQNHGYVSIFIALFFVFQQELDSTALGLF